MAPMNGLWAGLLLILAGGAMQGSFTIPQQFLRGWPWEMSWLLYSIAGMVVFAWVLFGLGVARVGTALGFAVIISLTAAVGALVPLVVLHPEQVWTRRGALVGLGLAIVIVGVVLCSRAGALKEAALGQQKS